MFRERNSVIMNEKISVTFSGKQQSVGFSFCPTCSKFPPLHPQVNFETKPKSSTRKKKVYITTRTGEKKVTKHAKLTRIKINGKLFQLIALDDCIDELTAERTFSLDGHRQRRMKFDIFRHRVRVELLAKYRHRFVDNLRFCVCVCVCEPHANRTNVAYETTIVNNSRWCRQIHSP